MQANLFEAAYQVIRESAESFASLPCPEEGRGGAMFGSLRHLLRHFFSVLGLFDCLSMNLEKQNGLIPAIIQDADTRQVLMLGYMNQEALEKTRREGRVTFFSRSKQRLWTKGETSGNFLHVQSIFEDCDEDTLLIHVHPQGPVCHTGTHTCFGEDNEASVFFLDALGRLIRSRHEQMTEGSYTTSLFQKGINKIAQKVGEEAVETIIEAKDDNEALFLNECADLIYHLMVLLEAKGTSLPAVVEVLRQRNAQSEG